MAKRNLSSTNYEKGTIPEDYKCDNCNSRGVKLWREDNTFADDTELLCSQCSAKAQKKNVSSMQSDGRYKSDLGMTDQIGWMIPAVPVEGDSTYWGYTSVPEKGCMWWRNLPNTTQ